MKRVATTRRLAPSTSAKRPTPPHGPSNRFFGVRHIRPLKTNFLAYASELRDRYGDAFRFRITPVDVVVFSHPDHFREVLVEHPDDFAKPRMMARAMRPLVRGAIAVAEGPSWAHRRKLVHSALARLDMERVAAPAARHTERMVKLYSGREINLNDTLERIVAYASVEATLGAGFEPQLDDVFNHTCAALDALAEQIGAWTPPWLPSARRRRMTRAADRFAVLCEQARRACLARQADASECLIAGLAAADGDGRGTPREVCEEAAMLFVGGKETAGPAATWMAYLLARHPDVQQCCADEVRSVVGDRQVTAADMAHLRLLDAAYKETLRLYAPAFMFVRESLRETTVGGYRVPRRSMVCLFVHATHRDTRWFDAPDEFRPDRFLDPAANDFSQAYLPFGLGKRGCPGGRMATVETVVALATILKQHRLVWDSGKPDPKPSILMGLRPPAGLGLRLEHALAVRSEIRGTDLAGR